MLGALSAASLTLGPGSAPAPFTAKCGNDGAANALATAPSFRTAVAVVDSDQLSPEKKQAQKYHFVVANAKFMLDEEEHFKELLFERLRYNGEHDKEQDFWLVIEPKFLDNFPDITKRLRRPAVALVSTNGPWITEKEKKIYHGQWRNSTLFAGREGPWPPQVPPFRLCPQWFMKLRLDRVLSDSYEADSLEEALASNPTKLEFEKPENWVAPYAKYEFGWWGPFLPNGLKV
ncbi:Fragile histidine triad isoform 1 [Hibiscus syriacus]|uniref:Fragile histidine triad isoform 1 n=1 Tax=Hibiscus syriacus TaxID=106335 RepID=A0A6A2XFF4_HIBSY|nr:Fragile histidine triad isoform 1 [Hibiscus syriacus]